MNCWEEIYESVRSQRVSRSGDTRRFVRVLSISLPMFQLNVLELGYSDIPYINHSFASFV